MEDFVKILELENEFEVERMQEILEMKNIPFGFIPVSDSAFGGIERLENGIGTLEAPASYREEILAIYADLRNE